MFKLNSWRLADVLTMALLAVPLIVCSDAIGNPYQAQQSRSRSESGERSVADSDAHSFPQRSAGGNSEAVATNDNLASVQQLSQAELRHFHVFQHYRAMMEAMDQPVGRKPKSVSDAASMQRAVLTFSARNMTQPRVDCSPRPLMMLD